MEAIEGVGVGSVCEVCASAVDVVGSGAEGTAGATAGAAPGRLRAALGANFLPVVFSVQDLAASEEKGAHTATHC